MNLKSIITKSKEINEFILISSASGEQNNIHSNIIERLLFASKGNI